MDREKMVELRKAKGLTQEELARQIGVSESMVSFYENGLKEPTIAKLHQIAAVLGCQAKDLIREI